MLWNKNKGQWIIMGEEEYKQVWGKIYTKFSFSPSIDTGNKAFTFGIPVKVYDISESPIWNDDSEIYAIIRRGFIL